MKMNKEQVELFNDIYMSVESIEDRQQLIDRYIEELKAEVEYLNVLLNSLWNTVT